MKKYYNLNEGYLSKLDDNNQTLISAVDVDNIDKYSKIEKDDKQSFEDFKTQYKGVIDMKCTQDYGNCEDKDLWEDCAKELFLTSKNYLLQGDEYKASDLEKKTENKQLTESNDILTIRQIWRLPITKSIFLQPQAGSLRSVRTTCTDRMQSMILRICFRAPRFTIPCRKESGQQHSMMEKITLFRFTKRHMKDTI